MTDASWQWGEPVARPETEVRICLRGDLVAAKDAAEAELSNLLREDPSPDVGDDTAVRQRELALEVDRLHGECLAASTLFRFRAMARKARTDLEAKHPPDDAQKEQAREAGFTATTNSETFPPALVAACCIEPAGVTLATAQQAFAEWAEGPWTLLWRACVDANMGSSDPGPKSVTASVVLRGSAPNSD